MDNPSSYDQFPCVQQGISPGWNIEDMYQTLLAMRASALGENTMVPVGPAAGGRTASMPSGASHCPPGTRAHGVGQGETLYAIAGLYGVTVEDIRRANPELGGGSLIYVGQTLCIPARGAAQEPCPPGHSYVLQPGDTLYSLARRYGLTMEQLLNANPGLDPNAYQAGITICLPCPGRSHTLQSGETLYGLTRRYGVTMEQLLAANPGLDPGYYQAGQVICIPGEPRCRGQVVVIQPGETLYALALRYGIPLEQLLAANPGLDPSYYQAGQSICIPTRQNQPQGAMSMLYTVEPQDTLGDICIKGNTSVEMLCYGNAGFDPRRIVPGTRLTVYPMQCDCRCETGRQVTVGQGMDLVRMAGQMGVSVDDLLLANPNLAPGAFLPGCRVCVPPGA